MIALIVVGSVSFLLGAFWLKGKLLIEKDDMIVGYLKEDFNTVVEVTQTLVQKTKETVETWTTKKN